VFRNNTRFPVGIHPHGVFYEESSEGAHYSIVPTGAGTAPDHNVMPETGADVKPGDYLSLGGTGTRGAGAIRTQTQSPGFTMCTTTKASTFMLV